MLYWGTFTAALANGTVEAFINPVTATLYPKEKTHYLNILHAGWPGGLVLGGLLAILLGYMPDLSQAMGLAPIQLPWPLRFAPGLPAPVSSTSNQTPVASVPPRTVMVPRWPSGVACAAFTNRFIKT